ncbi:hypothetical protein PAXRUDRAFT_174383 [Paxillus rubicundulus Ve08.2h10]|uniref:Uncharacterized protein n=1 Tax=Paxillus rubicundulus Ve08.2h10 TaxID=930991 RepID=A0A0D0DC94_9AGAM|nr:hypothetical protein PAXRUDRAFT_174383 [Paxillus rubicundulus Ve08.2h10]
MISHIHNCESLKDLFLSLVIPLTEVTQAVDLVPIFGASVDHMVMTTTSQEVYDKSFLNYYTGKECFNTLYETVGVKDECLDDKYIPIHLVIS